MALSRIAQVAAVAIGLLLASCTAQGGGQATSSPGAAAPTLPADTGGSVVSAVREVSTGAQVGLLVWDAESGRRLVAVDAATRHQSASLVKLLVAIAAERAGKDQARVDRMLRLSDNDIASALWDELGGDDLPGRVAASLGISGVGPPNVPGRWGNVRLSAEDLLVVYRHLMTELPALIEPLRDTPPTAASGFDQHFGIPSAFSKPWAVKHGWGMSAQATTAHTTGIVAERYVVVLLTSHPPDVGFGTATDAATAGAQALAAAL